MDRILASWEKQQTPDSSHMTPRLLPLALLVALLLAPISCRSPVADAALTEQMRQLADELNGARQDAAAIQGRIDSLQTVVAKQDTVIRQLANLAGMPLK